MPILLYKRVNSSVIILHKILQCLTNTLHFGTTGGEWQHIHVYSGLQVGPIKRAHTGLSTCIRTTEGRRNFLSLLQKLSLTCLMFTSENPEA